MGELWARLDQGEGIYDPYRDFSLNSAMTLTLDQETCFKITAHPLPKRHSLSKVRAWLDQGDKWSRPERRTDGQTDGQTDHYRASAERSSNKEMEVFLFTFYSWPIGYMYGSVFIIWIYFRNTRLSILLFLLFCPCWIFEYSTQLLGSWIFNIQPEYS